MADAKTEKFLLSIDLGLASGASLWRYSENEPAEMIQGWQILGGYTGLNDWIQGNTYPYMEGATVWLYGKGKDREIGEFGTDYRSHEDLTIIAEKWIPYPTRGHSPTLESTYPLVLEGVLIHEGLMPEHPHPNWRRSSLQYWMPGANAKIKRKAQENWLKETTDLFRTAGQMGVKHKDAQDYLSSVYHALSWFRSIDHNPTMACYWPQDAENPRHVG